jgi:hypothetical protein
MGQGVDGYYTLGLIKKQKIALDNMIEEMQKLTETVKNMNSVQQDLIKVVAAQNERIKKLENEKKWRDM